MGLGVGITWPSEKLCSNFQLSSKALPGGGQDYSNNCNLCCIIRATSNCSFCEWLLVGTAEKKGTLPDLKYVGLCAQVLFILSHDNASPAISFLICAIRVWFSAWPLSLHFLHTASSYCCHPHHRWQLSSSFIVLGLKTWQASGLLGQYNKSDCGGVLSSILQHLFGNSSPSEILLLSSWRLVEEIAGLVRVDGITSTFTAACRTLSFHVVFNGSGYATCRWFSVK